MSELSLIPGRSHKVDDETRSLSGTSCSVDILFSSQHIGKLNLGIVHINARSLLSCINDINHVLYAGQVDVLVVTETWARIVRYVHRRIIFFVMIGTEGVVERQYSCQIE